MVFAALLPVAIAIVTRPAMYNGIRHFLFVIPPLAVLGGLAAGFIIETIRKKSQQAAIATALVMFAGVIMPVIDMVRIHPYQYANFNRIAGGIYEADDNYMLDYWGLAFKQAAQGLRDKLTEQLETPTKGRRWRVAVCGPHAAAEVELGPEFVTTWEPKGADFAMMLGTYYCAEYDAPVLVEIEREDVVFARVYDIRGKNYTSVFNNPTQHAAGRTRAANRMSSHRRKHLSSTLTARCSTFTPRSADIAPPPGPMPIAFPRCGAQKQLEYTWTLTLAGHYQDFWVLTERALDFAFARIPSVDRALEAEIARCLFRARRFPGRAAGSDRAQESRPRHRHPVERLAENAGRRGQGRESRQRARRGALGRCAAHVQAARGSLCAGDRPFSGRARGRDFRVVQSLGRDGRGRLRLQAGLGQSREQSGRVSGSSAGEDDPRISHSLPM